MKCVTQIVLFLTLLLTLKTYASFDFEVQRKLNCHDDYRAKSGDILSVFYESFSKDGTKFNSTDNSPALQITLGSDRLMPGWEDNLAGRCAGDQVAAVVDGELFFIMDIAVITRVIAPAPSSAPRHFGILAGSSDKCDPASSIRPGGRVTMTTVATLPDLIYLKYSDKFPASNTPTKISEPGSRGVKVDESEDEVTIGAGELVRGWELGLAGACEGERRRIMMNHDMAYGEVGAFRLIPPRAALVLDVTIVKVDNSLSTLARRPRNNIK